MEMAFVSVIEYLAALLGICSLLLQAKQRVSCWPISIVGNLAYMVVFYHSRLYADFLLQGYYTLMSIYGWRCWLRGGAGHVKPRWLNFWGRVGIFAAALLLWWLIFRWLERYPDCRYAGFTSFTTAWSLVATWLLARKFIDNWAVWIAVNLCLIGVYSAAGLYPTAALYLIFAILSVRGYLVWRF